jgi:hypothetical protein
MPLHDGAMMLAIASMADVVAQRVAEENTAALELVCKAIDANGKAMRDALGEVRDALTKDDDVEVAGRVVAAIEGLKFPAANVTVRNTEVASAIMEMAHAIEKIGKMVAASNENVLTALRKLGEIEARELKVEMPAAPAVKAAPGHHFEIERGNNGEMLAVKVTPIVPHPIKGTFK